MVKDGWRITQRVEEPVGLPASGGLARRGGHRRPADALDAAHARARETDGHGNPIDDLGTSASADDPGKAYSRFEDWLASQVALQDGVHPTRRTPWSSSTTPTCCGRVPVRTWREVRAMPRGRWLHDVG